MAQPRLSRAIFQNTTVNFKCIAGRNGAIIAHDDGEASANTVCIYREVSRFHQACAVLRNLQDRRIVDIQICSHTAHIGFQLAVCQEKGIDLLLYLRVVLGLNMQLQRDIRSGCLQGKVMFIKLLR